MAAVASPYSAPCRVTFCSVSAIRSFPGKLTEIKLKGLRVCLKQTEGDRSTHCRRKMGPRARPRLDARAGLTFPRVPSTCEASGALGFLLPGAGLSPEENGRPRG